MQQEEQDEQQVQQIQPHEDEGQNLKLQLLYLSKEILQHRETMRWETHKQINNISVDDVIDSAKKLYNFIVEEK